MIFDVMLQTGFNAEGKSIIRVYRVHDSKLNEVLHNAQDEEQRILSVRPLFKKRPEVSEEDRKPFLIKKKEDTLNEACGALTLLDECIGE